MFIIEWCVINEYNKFNRALFKSRIYLSCDIIQYYLCLLKGFDDTVHYGIPRGNRFILITGSSCNSICINSILELWMTYRDRWHLDNSLRCRRLYVYSFNIMLTRAAVILPLSVSINDLGDYIILITFQCDCS